MKVLGIDWRQFFAVLPAWAQVPPPARRAFLDLRPSEPVTARELGDHLAPLQRAGLIAPGGKLAVEAEARAFLRVMRSWARHPIFARNAGSGALAYYLTEHFSLDELAAWGGRGAWGEPPASAQVARASWLRSFLDARDAARWAHERSLVGWAAHADSWKVLQVPAIARTLRASIEERVAGRNPIELRELLPAARESREALAGALSAGLRYALLFGALRPDDLEPLVGLWPAVHARLTRTPPAAPRPVEPARTFDTGWGLGDLQAVVAALAASPAQLRQQDGLLFTRTERELTARLPFLPEIPGTASRWAEPPARLDGAIKLAQRMGFCAEGTRGGRLHLEASPGGRAWLARPPKERLAALLNSARSNRTRDVQPYVHRAPGLDFWPLRLADLTGPAHATLAEPLSAALLAAPEGAFVPIAGFLDYQVRAANPLPALYAQPKNRQHGYGRPSDDDEELEHRWRELVEGFLVQRLLVLGGARLGQTAAGGLCFALTGVGRYLLGAARDFELPHAAAAGGGEVVVQPNFEVVFLGPSPAAEATFGRYGERLLPGAQVGVLYRLTAAAVREAAAHGATADDALAALAAASSRPLPAAVERQLRDWFAACRTVHLARAILLRCPDHETAARVRATLGAQAQILGETTVALAGDRLPGALKTKLRKAGLFVVAGPAEAD